MLTIGEFSRICFVTKKTLRHYDEIGLLRPEHTAENGYRYYTVSQLRSMLMISRLKKYGFSLPEIAAVLANPDEEQLARRIEQKRSKMEWEMQETRRILDQMDQDIDKLNRRVDILNQDIVVKTVELAPQKIYSVRKTMDVKHFSEMFAELFREMGEKKLNVVGPPMAYYHDEEFKDKSNADIEVGVPVTAGETRVAPGGLHCFATLLGPYIPEEFTAVYAGLYQWVQENGYHIAGAPFDKYVRGGDQCSPEEYVTEIYFPIAK